MKAGVLKELLSHIGDDEEVVVASDRSDFWQNTFVGPVNRVEENTVVWDENGRSFRLLKGDERVSDFEDDKHPHKSVYVLK